jgi:hypothetical protein
MTGLKFDRELGRPSSASRASLRGPRETSVDETPPNRDRRRRERLLEQLFTGVNVAVFLALIACVTVAAVLWERWH